MSATEELRRVREIEHRAYMEGWHDAFSEISRNPTLGPCSCSNSERTDLAAENAKLRAMRDTWQENDAKLRELVRHMWHELDAATQYDAGGGRGVVYEFADRMRELGIEVDE